MDHHAQAFIFFFLCFLTHKNILTDFLRGAVKKTNSQTQRKADAVAEPTPPFRCLVSVHGQQEPEQASELPLQLIRAHVEKAIGG